MIRQLPHKVAPVTSLERALGRNADVCQSLMNWADQAAVVRARNLNDLEFSYLTAVRCYGAPGTNLHVVA